MSSFIIWQFAGKNCLLKTRCKLQVLGMNQNQNQNKITISLLIISLLIGLVLYLVTEVNTLPTSQNKVTQANSQPLTRKSNIPQEVVTAEIIASGNLARTDAAKSISPIEAITANLPPTTTTAREIANLPTPTTAPQFTIVPPVIVSTLDPNRKLSTEEQATLIRLEQDIADLKISLDRIDNLMSSVHPDDPDWPVKFKRETDYWRKLQSYYKTNPMPGRIGTQLIPNWLAALTEVNKAGELLTKGYQQSDGILISQSNQQIAYAEQQIKLLELLAAKFSKE